jgi:hypothetical protein
MQRSLTAMLILLGSVAAVGCAKGNAQTTPSPQAQARPSQKDKPKIKPYAEVITDKAKSDSGLFVVHQVEDKWYYEIPLGMLEREMLLVSRRARTAANIGYGGEKNNTETVRWQRHDNRVLLRIVSYTNVADDSLPIFEAVRNANFEPIVQAFDIAAFKVDALSADTLAAVIEVTPLFTGDVPVLGLSRSTRERFKIRNLERRPAASPSR